MPLRTALNDNPPDRVWMNVFDTIAPGPPPWRIVDEHNAVVPRNPVIAPAPGTEWNSQCHAKTEADCGSYEKAWPRPLIDHNRIVIRDHNVVRTRGQNRNIRPTPDDDLRTGA